MVYAQTICIRFNPKNGSDPTLTVGSILNIMIR